VTKHYDVTGNIIAYENGELDQDDVVILFQHLIDSGLAYRCDNNPNGPTED
jgi:hypothetical protein